jgi:hypothetical protein
LIFICGRQQFHQQWWKSFCKHTHQ